MYDIKPTSYILRHFLCQCGISYPCLVPISADDVCAVTVSIDIELVLVAATLTNQQGILKICYRSIR